MLTYVDVQIVLLSGKKKNVIQHDATSSSFFLRMQFCIENF